MERRKFLRWAVHGLGAVFAAVLGFPAVVFLIDPRNRPATQRGLHPIGRLKADLDLKKPGDVKEVVIRETRRDAWTLHPDDVVGRVWLVRKPDAGGLPQIEAFNATCPHLGCSVNNTGNAFLCPCHGGYFRHDGTRINPGNNPAPRDMDTLEHKLALDPNAPAGDPDYVVELKYEKFKTNQAKKEVDA